MVSEPPGAKDVSETRGTKIIIREVLRRTIERTAKYWCEDYGYNYEGYKLPRLVERIVLAVLEHIEIEEM